MDEIGWKRDETPYIVFPCKKCGQFMYVKEQKKTKKCLRCGQSYKILEVKESSEIVYGMTTAVKIVKERQNDLALKELGTHPEFKSLNDFRITKNMKNITEVINKKNYENDYNFMFKKMLIELSEMYKEFPFYILEMMAEDYGIPESEVKLMISMFIKQGILIQLKSNCYKVRIL